MLQITPSNRFAVSISIINCRRFVKRKTGFGFVERFVSVTTTSKCANAFALQLIQIFCVPLLFAPIPNCKSRWRRAL